MVAMEESVILLPLGGSSGTLIYSFFAVPVSVTASFLDLYNSCIWKIRGMVVEHLQ